jgi:hypothetical protein
MDLIRGVDESLPRRMIIRSVVTMAESLGIRVSQRASRPKPSSTRSLRSASATCRVPVRPARIRASAAHCAAIARCSGGLSRPPIAAVAKSVQFERRNSVI